MPRRVFIYGSCVSRDAFTSDDADEFEVVRYVARQSLVSAFSGTPTSDLDLKGIESPFQRRIVEGDLQGDLKDALRESADRIDVILWDLTDERLGIVCTPQGGYITLSEEFRRAKTKAEVAGRHIQFGSTEHFDLFREAAMSFREFLLEGMLFDRVLLIHTPFTGLLDNLDGPNEELASELKQTADALNSKFGRYYHHLSRYLGFRMIALNRVDTTVSSAHQWGPAAFHYSQSVYSLMREALASTPKVTQAHAQPPSTLNHRQSVPSYDWASPEEFCARTELKDGEHFIRIGGTAIPLLLNRTNPIRQGQRLPVFFSGALTGRPDGGTAVFSGVSLAQQIATPFVSLGDPSTALRPLVGLSWYAGNQWSDVRGGITTVLRHVSTTLGSDLLLVGGSGGGFASLLYASELGERAAAVVWNPQTNIFRYGTDAVHRYLAAAFPTEYCYRGKDVSEETWRNVLGERGVIFDLCTPSVVSRLNHILYLQNARDWHKEAHLWPFAQACAASTVSNSLMRGAGDIALVVATWDGEHTPPPTDVLISAITQMMSPSASATGTAENLEISQSA